MENALIKKAEYDANAVRNKRKCGRRTAFNLICAAVGGCRVCSKPFTKKQLTDQGARSLHGDHHDYLVRMNVTVKDPVEDPGIADCFHHKWENFLTQLKKIEMTHAECNQQNKYSMMQGLGN